MSDATALSKKPFHKRWPGRHAFKTIHYSPDGSRIAMEFPADAPVASMLAKIMLFGLCGGTPSPELLDLFERVKVECSRLIQEKKKTKP